MKWLLGLGLAVLLTVPLAGCMKHTFTVGEGAPLGRVVYDHWHNHWLFGIIGDDEVVLEDLCPSGNATIHEETTFLNGLVAALIGAIYSPTTVTVRCDDGRSAALDLSAEQVASIAESPLFLERVEALIPDRLDEVYSALVLE